MTGDESNDVTRALAAFGGANIRYHSFGAPAVVTAPAAIIATPILVPHPELEIQPEARAPEAARPPAPLRRMPPVRVRAWPSPSAMVEKLPVAGPVEPVTATAAPAPASVAPYLTMPTVPATSLRPVVELQPASFVAVNPASPGSRSLADIFQLLAGDPEHALPPAQIVPDTARLG